MSILLKNFALCQSAHVINLTLADLSLFENMIKSHIYNLLVFFLLCFRFYIDKNRYLFQVYRNKLLVT